MLIRNFYKEAILLCYHTDTDASRICRVHMHNSPAVRTKYVYYFRKDAESYG